MRLLGNLLRLVLGGLLVALEYALAGLLLCLTLIGISFALQHLKLARLALTPFGYEIVRLP
ncbi:YccF domain-containing protein [Rhodothermus marinus]|uniref:YccF domain-containing protein n=1 Tax=Rhodothermus marinus TaxID=29549 RepID=UPI0037C7D921